MNIRHVVIAGAVLFALLLFLRGGAIAGAKPEIFFRDGMLDVNAMETPLIPLLESLAQAADIEIFVSDDLEPTKVTVQFTDMEIEDGLRSILKGVSYAVVYRKDGESWNISSLNIYPANKKTGRLTAVRPAKGVPSMSDSSGDHKIMLVDQYGESMYFGTDEGGQFIPSRQMTGLSDERIIAETNAPWFKVQQQLVKKESQKHQELVLMRKRLESAVDTDKKEALSLAYAEELADFHRMKVANLNKIESLKRIYQNREMNK